MTTKAAARPRSSEFYRELAERIEKAKDELVIEEIVKSLTKVELVILIKRLGRRQVENGAYTISALNDLKRQATEVSELQATIATQEELITELRKSRDDAEGWAAKSMRDREREEGFRRKAEAEAETQRHKAQELWKETVTLRSEVERLDRLSERRVSRKFARGVGNVWSKLDEKTQTP